MKIDREELKPICVKKRCVFKRKFKKTKNNRLIVLHEEELVHPRGPTTRRATRARGGGGGGGSGGSEDGVPQEVNNLLHTSSVTGAAVA
jgi:hypothetical protein